MKLKDKVVVVTGGTSGIGLAAVEAFVREGARVVLFARSEDVTSIAKGLGPSVRGIRGDVAREADVERLFVTTRETFGAIDVLFANAAQVRLAPIRDTSEELFDAIVAVNQKGVFYTIKHGIPHLRDGASVIVTTSYLGRIGFPGSSVVAMSKAAIGALVRVAAVELAPRGIRVNALCPGAIETPLWGKLGLPAEALAGAAESIRAEIPLGRWGKAEEVARAALFLASDDAAYVNASELRVDGGLHQV